jgi:hypothetical protein
MKRSGFANLPLHHGHVPRWLAERMTKLGTAIAETIIVHQGARELLSRLADPFWFQAFGCVMGMDWHSSGITTSVMGALKRGLNPRNNELGVRICGGRGKHSRNTPEELRMFSDKTGLDGDGLVRTSRLTARIDNNAIGDGFQIYLHNFVVTTHGDWTVVQQGLNENSRLARRYHWHSASVKDFVCSPHSGIVGEHQGTIMNLVDERSIPAQQALLCLVRECPDKTLQQVRNLTLPSHHDVRSANVDLKRLGAVLAVAYEKNLRDFASLLLQENLGPRTLQSLALIAEVIHGTPSRFSDPARFSFAHGGKDGHPFPVPLKTYDSSLQTLRAALDSAKLGQNEKLDGFKRLDGFVRAIETSCEPEAHFNQTLARERSISKPLSGRTVFDDIPKRTLKSAGSPQLALFERVKMVH